MTWDQLPDMKNVLVVGIGLIYFIKFSGLTAIASSLFLYVTQPNFWTRTVGTKILVSAFGVGVLGFIYGLSLSEWVWREW
ncbi:hypothetical protein ACBZ90_00955 (plasmid) [Vibrio alginolyticus]